MAPCRFLAPGAAKDVAFSADGTQLAAASGAYVKLYDAANGSELGATPWQTATTDTFSFGPGGLLAVGLSGSAGQTGVVVYRTSDMSVVQWLDGGRSATSVAFSPDGTWLAAAVPGVTGSDVDVWSVADYSLRTEITMATGVDAIAFTKDGTTLYATGSMGYAWSTSTFQATGPSTIAGGWGQLPWSRLVLADDGTQAVIDSYTSASATPPGGGTGYGFDSPETAQFEVAIKSHDSSMIAVGDAGGSVFVWQISSARTLLDRFADQTAAITGLAFTPDDSAIAAISDDGTVFTWRLGDGQQIWHSGATITPGGLAGASRDGSKVVLQSASGYSEVSATDGSLLGTFPVFGADCVPDPTASRVACSGTSSPNYSALDGVPVTAGIDPQDPTLVQRSAAVLVPGMPVFVQSLLLRQSTADSQTNLVLRFSDLDDAAYWDLPAPEGVSALAISDDGTHLAASTLSIMGSPAGIVWDVAGKHVLATFGQDSLGTFQSAAFVAMSPDGTWVALADPGTPVIFVADATGGNQRAYTVAGATGFQDLAVAPGGQLLAAEMSSSAEGGTMRSTTIVVDVQGGSVVALIPGAPSGGIAFLDDSTIVRGESDGATSVWCL